MAASAAARDASSGTGDVPATSTPVDFTLANVQPAAPATVAITPNQPAQSAAKAIASVGERM
jgi:hypothetical protein